MEVYAIKVTLLGTSPSVWRRILVPRDITLRNFHRTLQTAMGWTNCHLHQFRRQRQRLTDPRSRVGTKVADENGTMLGELIGTVGRGYCTSTISGTAGSTNFFLKKFCLERNRFSRFVWRVNDVVHPKTVVGRKDLQSFSKHSRTPITLVTTKSVSGWLILFLNPSL